MVSMQTKNITPKPQEATGGSRIAGNTLVLFLRMLILTLVNLYAIRLIIQGMGMTDYGIFNAVAGVVTVTNVFCGVLALSVQRFLSYSIGLNDEKKMQDIFSCSVNIVLILSLITLFLLESIGLYFINTQLNIPTERTDAVFWVYQFAIFTLICSFVQTPYTAAMFAHEDMSIYALISTIECLLKLLTAYLIAQVCFDHLEFYAFGLLSCAAIILTIYVCMGRSRYKECHYRPTSDKLLYKELLSFSGWMLFGSIAGAAMLQGNTILLNIFYGPIATAAFAISLQIHNAFNSLTSNLALAFRPPMIKLYAEGEHERLNKFFNIGNKCMFYALMTIALPILAEMDTILQLWLGQTNHQAILYARLIVIYVAIIAMHNPITIIIHATGNIKRYHLLVESFTLMCLPLTWVLFRAGLPDYSVLVSMITVCLLAHAVRLLCLRQAYSAFSIRHYLKSFLLPAAATFTICALFTYHCLHSQLPSTLWRLIVVAIFSPLFSVVIVYLFGINKAEKNLILQTASTLLNRKA